MNKITRVHSRPFLLMEGGPLFRLQKRVGLIRQDALLIKRRAVIVVIVTWVPLLLLSAIQGRVAGHSVTLPFLRDFGTFTRFLLAAPLLVLAENILGPRVAETAAHFVTSGLVIEKDYGRFDEIIERGLLARDSNIAEAVIAVLAYAVTLISFRSTAVHADSWYAIYSAAGSSLTWAGLWLLAVSVPLFQFLFLRWLWRLFLWFQFLARVRGLDLQLFPTHPDGAAGLGFVGASQRFFGIILFAISSASAGVLANDIIYDRVLLKAFAPAIAAYVIIAIIVLVGPLIVFTGELLRIKRTGLHQYGRLATEYTEQFHRKWIQHQNPEHEALLGSGDIQSLADLANSFNVVEKMKALPIDPRTVVQLVVASLLPMVPLLLTVMPLKDVLKLVFKLLA